jgi:NAD+ synthase (glutamine-hydrolysing)
MKLAIAQINSTVGDFRGNIDRIRAALANSNADLVVFPECALCGYPQRDLLDYPAFAEECEKYARDLVASEPSKAFVFGTIEKNRETGRPLRNVAIFADRGKVIGKYFKRLLPAYDVFDEDRFFEPGRDPLTVDFLGKKFGITICEDIWSHSAGTPLHNRYQQSPLDDTREATVILNLSASPFEYAKARAKRDMLRSISKSYGKPLVYANCVGANDDLIFDGRSYVWNEKGEVCLEAKAFEEDLCIIDLDAAEPVALSQLDDVKNIYDALLTGIRDYCRKQNFKDVVLGLSGGIDSAVVACLAVDALGVENVVSVMLPSRFTSTESNEDAIRLATAMKNPLHIFAIEEMFQATLLTMSKAFEGMPQDLTEENMQARIRGLILMSLSNKFGHLLLTTGNKSELAVGFCTLYGDTNGGLAPISDIYKTQVYELGREANRRWQRIPERVFTKAPTAELGANQRDEDRLPPYDRLDQILRGFIEEFMSSDELIRRGLPKNEVEQVRRWIGASEFKRYQMPLGLKVSSKAFGIGRRMPLVQKFL